MSRIRDAGDIRESKKAKKTAPYLETRHVDLTSPFSRMIFQTLPSVTVLIHSPAQCSHYLCPGTLSCVHFPHHCPCAWEANEDKVELGEGIAVCGSKGGWIEGEFAKKVELARKGLL